MACPRSFWTYGIVLGVSLLIRLPHAHFMAQSVLVQFPVVDASLHHEEALRMLTGQAQTCPYFKPPLYPAFLSVIYTIWGAHPQCVPWIQALLGSLTCVLIAGLTSSCVSPRAALPAGLFSSLYGPFLAFEGQILAPPLTLFLTTGSCLILAMAPGWPWVSGVLLGLSIVARPEMAIVCPIVMMWLATRSRKKALLFVVSAMVPLGIVAWRNWTVSQRFVLLSTNGGINLYTGWREDADGFSAIEPGYAWERTMRFPKSLGLEAEEEISAYWGQRAWSFIRDNPADAATLLAKKALGFWTRFEIRNNVGIEAVKDQSWLLRLPFPGFGSLFPLFAAGITIWLRETRGPDRGLKRLRQGFLPLSFALGLYASVIPFFVCDRFRLSIVPFLIPFAGVALAKGIAWTRLDRGTLWAGTAALFAAALSWPDTWAVGHGKPHRDLWLLGAATLKAGRLADAKGYFEKGLSLNDEDPDLWLGLGNVLLQQGETAAAITAFERALSRAPDYSVAQGNLAAALLDAGAYPSSLAWAKRAQTLAPDLEGPHLVEARALLATGKKDEALSALRSWIRSSPQSEQARKLLALVESQPNPTDRASP